MKLHSISVNHTVMQKTKNISLIILLLATAILSGCKGNLSMIPTTRAEELPSFDSCVELQSYLDTHVDQEEKYRHDTPLFEMTPTTPGQATKSESIGRGTADGDYSTTNVQVAGIDEADQTKTDGKYIYRLSNNTLYIVEAVPAGTMKVLATIAFTDNNSQQATEFFILDNRLVVFGTTTVPAGSFTEEERSISIPSTMETFMKIYDLTDRTEPRLERSLEVNGNYTTSRMIDSKVYVVLNTPIYANSATKNNNDVYLPLYRDSKISNTEKPLVDCTEVRYIPDSVGTQYITLLGFDLRDTARLLEKEVILGSGETVYASAEHLYITETARSSYNDTSKKTKTGRSEETKIYKFGLDQGTIEYQGQGNVPGTVLNQFSLDEYEGNLRIVTTERNLRTDPLIEFFFGEIRSRNNLYVLDPSMKTTGQIEGIAPGETLYSARFMGKRGYLVTFKKVDPFFTVDLSDPQNPKILGKLKIPGYSDYLHPYDENHIIGIGKDTVQADNGDFAWYQGVKMALFDVRDPENPKELHKVIIGDRGSDSPVLTDHKAFLFDRERNLLILPVSVTTSVNELPDGVAFDVPFRNDQFQGAYVYNLTRDKGFDLKGKISHAEAAEDIYFNGKNGAIDRSLFIGDTIYTLSDQKIIAHSYKSGVEKQGEVLLQALAKDTNTSTTLEWTIE